MCHRFLPPWIDQYNRYINQIRFTDFCRFMDTDFYRLTTPRPGRHLMRLFFVESKSCWHTGIQLIWEFVTSKQMNRKVDYFYRAPLPMFAYWLRRTSTETIFHGRRGRVSFRCSINQPAVSLAAQVGIWCMGIYIVPTLHPGGGGGGGYSGSLLTGMIELGQKSKLKKKIPGTFNNTQKNPWTKN